MRVTLESTSKIVVLNSVPARIWEGQTDSGIRVHAFVTRIAADKDANLQQFETELKEQRAPSLNDDANREMGLDPGTDWGNK